MLYLFNNIVIKESAQLGQYCAWHCYRIGYLQYLLNSLTFIYIMRKQRKANNIFEKQILPESMFHDEVEKQFRIGGVKIQGGWLENTSLPVYRANLKSAMQLIELQEHLQRLKQQSATDPVDMFKIAELQKKTQNFELMQLSPRKQKRKTEWNIDTGDLILQKLSDFWGPFQRTCRISENNLIVKSEKQKKQITIDLTPYVFNIENKTSNNKISQGFPWIDKFLTRLIIHNEGLRTYCIYGPEKMLMETVRLNRIKKVEIEKGNIFQKLHQSYFNKVLISFGNKIRVFDNAHKQKIRDNTHIAFKLLEKSNILPLHIEQQELSVHRSSQRNLLSSRMNSPMNSPINSPANSTTNYPEETGNIFKKNNQNSQMFSFNSPILRSGNLNESSMFRMRSRRSTIHYDQLEQEEKIYESPDFNVKDINLQFKQVVQSEEDISQLQLEREFQNENWKNIDTFNYASEQLQKQVDEKIKTNLKKPDLKLQEPQNTILQKREQYQSDSQIQSSFKKTTPKSCDRSSKQEKSNIIQQYQIYPTLTTHILKIGYFEAYFPYHQNEVQFEVVQIYIPETEYEGMKQPIINYSRVFLHKVQGNIFIPKQDISLECSDLFNEFLIVLKHGNSKIKHYFKIKMNIIHSYTDQSQFLYMKRINKNHEADLVCAGKLKIVVSQNNISSDFIFREQSTLSFLKEYLLCTSKLIKKKYSFMAYKRRNCEIRLQWHHKLLKKIIRKSDHTQFQKIVFLGISNQILMKIQAKAKTFKPLQETFSQRTLIQDNAKGTYSTYLALIERQLLLLKASDIRVVMDLKKYINLLITQPKNELLTQRLQSVKLFLVMKYGRDGQHRLMAAFVLEVTRKLQNLLVSLSRQQQIVSVIREYFEIQYEIDDLFLEIASYFL